MPIKLIDTFESNTSNTILAKMNIDGIIRIVKYRFNSKDLNKMLSNIKSFNIDPSVRRLKLRDMGTNNYINNHNFFLSR